ncbi:MAG: chemotaxis protein CheB [Proteobacteria bacterium]|nr:chemotaxis protein CheB [Pseudomonadota bacterium]
MTMAAHPPLRALAIGGSAGGLDALTQILPHLPARAPLAVFVVLHVRRQRPSILADIVASHCGMEVHEAEDKEPVRAGVVYVAPPDYHLLIADGPSIALSVDDAIHFSRPSIDALFETAAEQYGPALAGIVLSGANADGAAGLAAIERQGGRVFVQEPATAQAREMVEAAAAATRAATIAPPAALGPAIVALMTGTAA